MEDIECTTRSMLLCKECHPDQELPGGFNRDNAVFPSEIDKFDFNELYRIANKAIKKPCSNLALIVSDDMTDMTPALVAVIEVCMDRHIDPYLYYFDRESGEYQVQYIPTYPCG